jgi:3-oxoacyl-[acyl-carrier protein] reductase
MNKNWSKEKQEKVKNNVPLKRLGNPNDIAGPIIFLLSDESSYITGHTLDVNGGIWMN